jgi:esterase/lipase
MKKEKIKIGNIPALLYGTSSQKLYIFVHGRYGKKEDADSFAAMAAKIGYQTISFDLPEHGERKDEEYRCTIQNGIHDLKEIYSFFQNKYRSFSLFACSLGAYFSLSAYQNVKFEKCLFLSPVLDMERLIQNMMRKSNVSEEELKEKMKIETSFGETLSWDYYEFVRNNPIEKWDNKTFILYGENDNITEKSILDSFVKKYNCNLEVLKNGEHWFHTVEQSNYLENWIQRIIEN